jgi:hypothetical protein
VTLSSRAYCKPLDFGTCVHESCHAAVNMNVIELSGTLGKNLSGDLGVDGITRVRIWPIRQLL